jgi:two-component system sensor kinase FixL
MSEQPAPVSPASTTGSTNQSRALLDAIIQSLPFRVWACDPAGRCILQNPISERDFGPFLGKLASQLPLPPESISRWLQKVARAQAGEVVNDEATIPVAGELRTYQCVIAPIQAGEQIHGTVGVDIDVTDQRRSERVVRESEERFRQLASSIDEGFWLIDLAPERLLYVNPAFERIWGVPAEQLHGHVRGGERWIHPEHRRFVHEIFDDWLAGLHDIYDVEYRIVRPDGQTRWVRDRGAKIVNDRGQVYRASGIVRDITEQRAAEQALRDSEARYRLLANHSSDMITRHGADGKWRYLSPAAKTMLGFHPDELVGLDPFEFIHSDDRGRLLLLMQELVTTGRTVSATYRLRRSDGEYIWVESRGTAVPDSSSGKVTEFIATSRDVTEQLESSRKLRQREADLAHTERLSTMGQMASEMAHELNQPLYAIANFAEACLGKLKQEAVGSQPNDLGRWIEQIAQQARRAGDVVRRIAQFVRKGELDPELIDLNQRIRDTSVLLEFATGKRGIHVEYDLAENLPPVVADRLLIEQVLLNLVRNAAEAMNETEPQRRKLAIRSFRDEGGSVGVAVSDCGRGIAASHFDRLFEPYFTTKPDGTGMGLAICRSTIEAHGGRIWAENNAAGGATFSFVLPAVAGATPSGRSAPSA